MGGGGGNPCTVGPLLSGHPGDFENWPLNRDLKVGVHLKAIFTPLKIGQMKISCLHFKQYKNPPFIAQINDLGCFMNFWVIFRYIWKEIIFLEGLVKLKEIRNVEDLVKF